MLVSCGKAPFSVSREVIAPKVSVKPNDFVVRKYPKEQISLPIQLNSNAIFFWKNRDITNGETEEALAAKTIRVMQLGREIEVLTKTGNAKNEKLKPQRAEIELKMNLVDTEIKLSLEAQSTFAGKVSAKSRELRIEKLKKPPNLTKIEALNKEISELKKSLEPLNVRHEEILKEKKDVQDKMDLVEKENLELVQIRDQIGKHTAELMGKVDYFSRPSKVKLGFKADGAPLVEIRDWDIGAVDKKKDYSNDIENPNITDAKYEELGGVFVFKVSTEEGDFLQFKVSRTRYKQEEQEQRPYFYAEVRCWGGPLCASTEEHPRIGVGKFTVENKVAN